ncbi:MAG: ribonuclease HII [Leptolyngbyaceae cyanobacterium MO_188.B28]|nr:ribonuclease HII [Leptolyngbyaceae cyanobacterium MO_188.B28]
MEGQWIAGVDEVGRGALFGPVVAAAVILPPTVLDELTQAGVKDSKQLSSAKRIELSGLIRSVAIDAKIGMASVQEIDRINILQASLLAMKRAILRLSPQPALCLIDGNQLIPGLGLSQQAITKGDQSSIQIAAASILAKVWRDTLVIRLDRRYSGYDLASNKGYGSTKHRVAIANLGITRQHRRSFKACQSQCVDTTSRTNQLPLSLS